MLVINAGLLSRRLEHLLVTAQGGIAGSRRSVPRWQHDQFHSARILLHLYSLQRQGVTMNISL